MYSDMSYITHLARDLACIWPRWPHQYYLCATSSINNYCISLAGWFDNCCNNFKRYDKGAIYTAGNIYQDSKIMRDDQNDLKKGYLYIIS
jgi:hypothetical protein